MPFPKGLVEVRTSGLQGRGLFARVDIPCNTTIWRFKAPEGDANWESLADKEPNRHYSEAEIKLMESDPSALATLLWGSYMHEPTGRLIELRDGDQFTNHSDNPNCGGPWSASPEDEAAITVRDIKAGDEITDDYGVFRDTETDWVAELFKKYTPDRYTFEKECVKPMPVGFTTGIDGERIETQIIA
jgi:SET domain-containing protein